MMGTRLPDVVDGMTKVCCECGKVKPLAEFRKNKDSLDSRQYWCKSCSPAVIRQHPKQAQYALKRYYGMTQDDYDDLLVQQGGTCAICGGVDESGRRLSVDHCHTHGTVRALLCGGCNKGIGHFLDNPTLLRIAADYLEAYDQNSESGGVG